MRKVVKAKKSAAENFVGAGPISGRAQALLTKPVKSAPQAQLSTIQLPKLVQAAKTACRAAAHAHKKCDFRNSLR